VGARVCDAVPLPVDDVVAVAELDAPSDTLREGEDVELSVSRLEAVMLVVDKDVSLTVTGAGDVIEPSDGIIAIGSGGSYALAAARALIDSDLEAMAIAEKAMAIAAQMCVYTNSCFVKDELSSA